MSVRLVLTDQESSNRNYFLHFSFSMFYSPAPYHDLIFQDSTRQLQVIEPKDRWYSDYLGPDFMRAKRITDCEAGATSLTISLLLTSTFLLSTFAHKFLLTG